MDLNFRPIVDGQAEPSLEEIVFGYFYNNLPITNKVIRYIREEAEELTRKYFEALDANPS